MRRPTLGLAAIHLAREAAPELVEWKTTGYIVPLADSRRARLIEEHGADAGMEIAEHLRHEEKAKARAVPRMFRQRKGADGER